MGVTLSIIGVSFMTWQFYLVAVPAILLHVLWSSTGTGVRWNN